MIAEIGPPHPRKSSLINPLNNPLPLASWNRNNPLGRQTPAARMTRLFAPLRHSLPDQDSVEGIPGKSSRPSRWRSSPAPRFPAPIQRSRQVPIHHLPQHYLTTRKSTSPQETIPRDISARPARLILRPDQDLMSIEFNGHYVLAVPDLDQVRPPTTHPV